MPKKVNPDTTLDKQTDLRGHLTIEMLTPVEGILQASFIEQDRAIIALNGTLAEIVGVDNEEQAIARVFALLDNPVDSSAHPIQLSKSGGGAVWVQYQCSEVDYGGRPARLCSIVNLTYQIQLERCLNEAQAEKIRLLDTQYRNQEIERKRIGIELHDGVGSYLTALKLRIEQYADGLPKQRKSRKFLDELIPMIQAASAELRQCIMTLRPPLLDDLGLKPALTCLIRNFQMALPSAEIKTSISIDEQSFEGQLDIAIYRVVQEALNNIAKYAKAKKISITLEQMDQTIQLVVEDDGVGFSVGDVYNGVSSPSGLGLCGMKERVILSQGTFSISTDPGSGTKVRAVWNNL